MIKKLIRRILGTKTKESVKEGAKESRPDNVLDIGPETPAVLGPKEHAIDPQLLSPNAVRVTQTLQDAGFKA
ncbi:MAG: polynucleotide adenylyltransferase PcnB, partial [Burkholderiales bacterium]